ncbi:isopentenyl-diphosphate Delta-isomerase [Sarracenia purpurea var. burkii]
MACVEIDDLGLIERDIRVLGVMINLHRFDVWGDDLAERALPLAVFALLDWFLNMMGKAKPKKHTAKEITIKKEPWAIVLFLEAAAHTWVCLGGLGGVVCVEIDDLGLVERDLRVLSIVMNLHQFDVRGGDLAERALPLGVSALLNSRPVGLPRLTSAHVRRRRRVDFRRDFFCRVLLRVRLPRHL